MNEWMTELERCKVKAVFSEVDIYWADDLDYSQHVEVYGKRTGSKKAKFERVGDARTYCHGFLVWSCGCLADHSEPEIVAGWGKSPKHATTINVGMARDVPHGGRCLIGTVAVKRTRGTHPEFGGTAAKYRLRVPAGMAFEIYDKPYNVGMVIIRPILVDSLNEKGVA